MTDQEDKQTEELVRKIWDVYGKFTGPQLSNLTHMPGTPWDENYKSAPRSEIKNESIKQHFIQLVKQRSNAQ